MTATCVRDAESEHIALVSDSRCFPGTAGGPNSDIREMAATLKGELQTHTLDLNLTLSQFVFPVKICWRNQSFFFASPPAPFAWNVLITKFVSGGKTQDVIKMNAANHD